jgi:hypothetical protein
MSHQLRQAILVRLAAIAFLSMLIGIVIGRLIGG